MLPFFMQALWSTVLPKLSLIVRSVSLIRELTHSKWLFCAAKWSAVDRSQDWQLIIAPAAFSKLQQRIWPKMKYYMIKIINEIFK